MERQLIHFTDQYALRQATGSALAAEEARIRSDQRVPTGWRLDLAFAAFYDPTGMTQAEIDAYDAAQLSTGSERESLTPSVLAMLGTVVRGRMGAAAWNALSLAAKKQAVKDEAAVFKAMREFVDKGV